jgi:cell division protein FtsB
MVPIDDLRKKAEEGLKTLKEAAQDLAFTVEKQARLGKMKYVDLSRVQRSIQDAYAEIGEYVYYEATAGRGVRDDDPYIAEKVSAITAMKAEMADIEREIDEMQRTQPAHTEER